MGWKPPERYRDTYRLVFADPEYHGLEVAVRRVSFGAFRATAGLGSLDRDKLAAGQLDAGVVEKLNTALTALGKSLVSWNLEEVVRDDQGEPVLDDQGQPAVRPVPCTPEALDEQDLAFGLELVDAWMAAAGEHQVPQPRPEPVELGDLPVDVLGQ